MAEHATAGAPALSTNIESGKFDEKAPQYVPAKQNVEDEEEDEDMDALIEDLESHDGHDAVSLFFFPINCFVLISLCAVPHPVAYHGINWRPSQANPESTSSNWQSCQARRCYRDRQFQGSWVAWQRGVIETSFAWRKSVANQLTLAV